MSDRINSQLKIIDCKYREIFADLIFESQIKINFTPASKSPNKLSKKFYPYLNLSYPFCLNDCKTPADFKIKLDFIKSDIHEKIVSFLAAAKYEVSLRHLNVFIVNVQNMLNIAPKIPAFNNADSTSAYVYCFNAFYSIENLNNKSFNCLSDIFFLDFPDKENFILRISEYAVIWVDIIRNMLLFIKEMINKIESNIRKKNDSSLFCSSEKKDPGFKNDPDNAIDSGKFKTNLNLEQFAYFFRLMLTEKNFIDLNKRGEKSRFFRFIISNFEFPYIINGKPSTFISRLKSPTEKSIKEWEAILARFKQKIIKDKENLQK